MCIANDKGREEIQLPNGVIRRPDGTSVQPGDPNYPIIVGPGIKRLNATDVPIGDGLAGSARRTLLSRRERIENAMGEGE